MLKKMIGATGFVAAVVGLLVFAPTGFSDEDEHEENHERRSWHRGDRGMGEIKNAQYKAECGSCHTLYHPGLLPERSWRKMMKTLDQHFGDNAELEPKVNAEITDFLVKNAADRDASRRSSKVNRAIPADSTPLRFTETYYFKRKHHELSDRIYKREKIKSPANCAACHPGAEKGDFEEDRVRIPK